MIINIAGTSGSGKSHLVRDFIKWVGDKRGLVKPRYKDGRKEPIGYDVSIKGHNPIHIVGAYESADSAGCDNIHDVAWVYNYIKNQAIGFDVLYEGLFMMNMTRGPQLAAENGNMTVIQLADPLSVCIASIDARREARGEGKLLKKENTIGNFKRAASYCDKMSAAGAQVIRTKRAEALPVLIELFGF
jgi:hypothetical protein